MQCNLRPLDMTPVVLVACNLRACSCNARTHHISAKSINPQQYYCDLNQSTLGALCPILDLTASVF